MYVNGYVLAVPDEKKDAYVAAAKIFAEVAKDFGAVEIFENWELVAPVRCPADDPADVIAAVTR